MSSCFQTQVTDQKLSEQRAALERGQNPLPLYLSLNVKENHLETLHFKGKVLPTHLTHARRLGIPLIEPKRQYDRYDNDYHTNKVGNERMAQDIVDFLVGWEPFLEKLRKAQTKEGGQ